MPKTNDSKLSMASMKKFASRVEGLALPKGDPSAAAKALQDHFKSTVDEDKLAACGVCGYAAHEEIDPCPFCGTSLGSPTTVKTPKTKTPKTKTSATKGSKKSKTKPRKKGAKIKKPKEEIIPATPEAIEEVRHRVETIRGFRRNLAEDAYNIGVELKEIRDKHLYAAMPTGKDETTKDDDGNETTQEVVGYKSFAEFCVSVLDYTRVMAYKYIAMAEGYDKETAIAIGPTKAFMLLNAPEKKRKRLIQMATEGASRSDLEAEIRKIEGRSTSSAPSGPNGKITLVQRVSADDVEVPWLSTGTNEPILRRDVKGKYAEFVLDEAREIKLIVTENENGKALVFSFKKVEKEAAPPAE